MICLYKIDDLPELDEAYITIGNFDGLHIAHQRIINTLINKAGRKPKIVISFCESPRKILKPESFSGYLMPVNIKNQFLSHLGVDFLICPDFIKIKNMTATEFLDFLSQKVKIIHFVIGFDSVIGSDRKGIDYINDYLQEKHPGGTVETMDQMFLDGQRVSSSGIRRFIKQGKIEEANSFLGRPYLYYSIKVSGDKIGKKIGFPTVNLKPNEQVLPKVGVYFTIFYVNQTIFPAMTYIGTRPTVKGKEMRVETNIIGFQGRLAHDFYPLLFIKRIRGEKTLKNVEELKDMLYNDRTTIRRLFSEYDGLTQIKQLMKDLFPDQ